jgi:hypothetical protein
MVTQDVNNGDERDIFVANSIYPDAKAIFTWRLEVLDAIKEHCIVVLDTNVLLVPYDISPKGLG